MNNPYDGPMGIFSGQENKEINDDTHIYLYAKHWYNRSDVIKDLQIILAERADCESDCITRVDILYVLIPIFCEVIKNNPEHHMIEVLSWTFLNGWSEKDSNPSFTDMIENILQKIGSCKVEGLNLGKPDYNILPKRIS
jgi:hypothetical protein